MKVLVLSTNDRNEASTRYRFYQYVPALLARGHSYSVSAFYPELPRPDRSPRQKLLSWARGTARQLRAVVASYDVVIVQRYVYPALLNELSRLVRGPIVYDFDDALWLSDRYGASDRMCARATKVIVGNSYLADHARRFSAHVDVVPTVIDSDRFVPVTHHNAVPVVGWIGSPSTFPFLESKLDLLNELGRELRFRLRIVGAPHRVSLSNVEVEQPAWSDAAEPALFASLDVGLYPLSDDPWSRGKCGLKSIQYMACGVPHVASPVGVVREISEHENTALWAGNQEEWRRGLRALLADRALRSSLTERGRARVESAYSLSAWAPRWVSMIESAVG